jgi:DNA-binding GntR family transcriptional regulator
MPSVVARSPRSRTRKTPSLSRPQSTESKAEPASSLTERAYRELEEQIVTLRLAPGTPVSEASLSKRLGIGRTPVREALQRLARERLVVILPRRGILVSEVNVRTQMRLLEVRRELERLLARAATRRCQDSQRQQFTELAKGMEAAARVSDDLAFMRLDRNFNQLMLEAARNEFANSAMALINGLSRRFWYIHYRQVADLPLAARLHADVARAVSRGDEDAAAAASDRLVDYIEAFARATLDSDG